MFDNIKSRWGYASFTVTIEQEQFSIRVRGRVRWALEQLIEAGAMGCTPIETPGPRWSGYVFDLRELGVRILTFHEQHDGAFPGTHARYVLDCSVAPEAVEGAA